MRELVRRLGASMTSLQFRRVPDGWIFRAPRLFGLGPQPHFLVDDGQKGKIDFVLAIYFSVAIVFMLLPIAWIAAYPLMSLRTPSDWNNHLLIFFALSLGPALAGRLIQHLALRLLLKNSPRTSARRT